MTKHGKAQQSDGGSAEDDIPSWGKGHDGEDDDDHGNDDDERTVYTKTEMSTTTRRKRR